MIDWITWSIEFVGAVILVIWTVLPIQEFKLIATRLRQERRAREASAREGQQR